MSLLGNIAGHAVAAVGRTVDYATPGAGTGRITNVGRAVYNPNVVLSNPGGILSSSPAFTPTSTAQPAGQRADTGQVQGTTDVFSGTYNGDGTSSADELRKAQAVDYINRAYDTKIAGFQDQLGTLDPMEQAANLQIANQYTNRGNDLSQNLATGQRNLRFATDQVNTQKARSLDDLSRQIQQMHMGYNNQLGAYGAGDSSAAGLINQALAGQANRNRGDVLQNSSSQLNQIGMQEQDLHTSFDSQKRALEDWKQSTLSDLMTGFAQQRAQIRDAMSSADLSRQQQLAQYDTSLTQAVMDRLSQIESQGHAAAADLQNRYMTAFAPQDIQIDPRLQQYAVQSIDPGRIEQLATPNSAMVNDNGTQVLLKRLQDEQNNLGV